MQITSLSSATFQVAGGTQTMNEMKKSLEELGSAVESGDLSSAKNLLTQMQKNAPAQSSDNPMSQKMDALSKAVESGDVKAAQQAYADVKKTLTQRPPAGGTTPSPQGAARGGQHPSGAAPSGGQKSSGSTSSSSSSSTKTYDKKDANKDGTVSTMEEIEYDLKHPDKEQGDSTNGLIDVTG